MKKYELFDSIQKVKEIVESKEFFEKARTKSNAFIRNRKMPFLDVVYFMMSAKRHCFQREINTYFRQRGKETVRDRHFVKAVNTSDLKHIEN